MNSLGQLKFNFANPFSVYMHGTPHQELFDKAERDFSSGCVRLEDPVRVGEILLSYNKDKGGWSQQRINDTIDAGKSVWVLLAKPMPIYFLYWSVFANNYDSLLMDKMKKKDAN
jgi:murein L,D-transpeptidase YcbB/YkuD